MQSSFDLFQNTQIFYSTIKLIINYLSTGVSDRLPRVNYFTLTFKYLRVMSSIKGRGNT
jgi:hypothetical protein